MADSRSETEAFNPAFWRSHRLVSGRNRAENSETRRIPGQKQDPLRERYRWIWLLPNRITRPDMVKLGDFLNENLHASHACLHFPYQVLCVDGEGNFQLIDYSPYGRDINNFAQSIRKTRSRVSLPKIDTSIIKKRKTRWGDEPPTTLGAGLLPFTDKPTLPANRAIMLIMKRMFQAKLQKSMWRCDKKSSHLKMERLTRSEEIRLRTRNHHFSAGRIPLKIRARLVQLNSWLRVFLKKKRKW